MLNPVIGIDLRDADLIIFYRFQNLSEPSSVGFGLTYNVFFFVLSENVFLLSALLFKHLSNYCVLWIGFGVGLLRLLLHVIEFNIKPLFRDSLPSSQLCILKAQV